MTETFLLFAGQDYYPTRDDLISIHNDFDSAKEKADAILHKKLNASHFWSIKIDWWTIYSSKEGKVASSWEEDDD